MIGLDDNPRNLGVIPSAISWLFRLIQEQRERTGARFSVRVSAVEVTGKHETLKDLLVDVAQGGFQYLQLCDIPALCFKALRNGEIHNQWEYSEMYITYMFILLLYRIHVCSYKIVGFTSTRTVMYKCRLIDKNSVTSFHHNPTSHSV